MACSGRTVHLEPHGTIHLVLSFVPTVEAAYYADLTGISFREMTPGQPSKTATLTSRNGFVGLKWRGGIWNTPPPNILMAAALSGESFVQHLGEEVPVDKETRHTHKSPPTPSKEVKTKHVDYSCSILTFKRAAADWPTDARVYATFDAVVVTPALQAAFPPNVRQALADFERLGGCVLVTPDDSASGGLADAAVAKRFRNAIKEANTRLRSDYSTSNFSNSLKSVPLSVRHTLPTEVIFVLLAGFSFLLIPITLFICARRNKRLWILVILPGASLVLSACVALCALAVFGLTPSERLQSITLLDQRTQHALTRGQFGVFSPRTISSGLHIPQTTELRVRHRESEGNLHCRLGEDLELVGSWIPALTATFFDFQDISHQAEKLDFQLVEGNALRITNLLGARIVEGRVNFKGRTYSLGTIDPGQIVTRSPEHFTGGHQLDVAAIAFDKKQSFGRNWPQICKKLAEPRSELTASTYFARLDGSPFFPSPFGTRKTHASRESLVIGTFAEERK